MSALTITPLHPSLGAEVSGIDLSGPSDPDTREALSQALGEHLALVFHDQSLTPAQYLQAAALFGPPMRQHYSQHNMPDYPDIGLVWHRNGQRPAERGVVLAAVVTAADQDDLPAGEALQRRERRLRSRRDLCHR